MKETGGRRMGCGREALFGKKEKLISGQGLGSPELRENRVISVLTILTYCSTD
jgi:hypothetical protein